VVNSDIEAERDHLRVGDHIVRVLTLKEAITETRPLVLDALLKIPPTFMSSRSGRHSPRTRPAKK
jgi:type IV secretion system protein VirB4